jgi:hypothetical protein
VRIPTLAQAETFLAQAAGQNPGPWEAHSRVAAGAARDLAAGLPGLDPAAAYVLGLLHDVGRGSGGPGIPDVRHILDGYTLLADAGFDDAAQVCLTHSFPIKEVDAFASPWGDLQRERRQVAEFLERTPYTDYDRLIQLVDALALPSGCCLLEKRLVDVALRHGVNARTVAKWQAVLGLQSTFEATLGTSIYRRLPGVVETTFGPGFGAGPAPEE